MHELESNDDVAFLSIQGHVALFPEKCLFTFIYMHFCFIGAKDFDADTKVPWVTFLFKKLRPP